MTVVVPGMLLGKRVMDAGGMLNGGGEPGKVEAVEFIPGYGTEDGMPVVPGIVPPVPVREEGGILKGADDPGKVETVLFIGGYGTVLDTDGICEMDPVSMLETVELPVANVALSVPPVGKLEFAGTDDGGAWIEDAELPVSPADAAETVELDKGNGAELGDTGYERLNPDTSRPVERGPTVSVKEGVVVADNDELSVTGGYPENVSGIEAVGLLVKLPKDDDVETTGLTVPEPKLVDELDAGYGTEVAEPNGVGVTDSGVETGPDVPPEVTVPGVRLIVEFDVG